MEFSFLVSPGNGNFFIEMIQQLVLQTSEVQSTEGTGASEAKGK